MKALKSFFFENKSDYQTIAKNTFWLFFGNIFSRLIRFAILIYAARILGVSGWGVFSYALSLAAFFTIFIDFGVNAIITRESSRDLSLQHQYFSTALLIKIFLFVLVGFLIYFISPLFIKQPEVLALLPLVILIVGFDGLRDFGATLSRAWEKMEVESFIQIITNVLIVIVGFAALYFLPSAKSLAIGYVIGTGVGMIVAFYPFRHYFKNIRGTFSNKLIKPILAASWPFGMMGLMGALMLNTDTIMIGWFKDINEVGYYSAAQRIAQLFYIIPTLIATAFFPAMAKSKDDPIKFKNFVEKSLTALSFIALPLMVGGVLLAGPIIKLLYSSLYTPSIIPFILMNLTYIPVFISAVLGNALFSLNQEKKLVSYVVLGIVGNFLFNLILIPYFGGIGAAVSTVVNQVIITIYLFRKIKKISSFTYFEKITKMLLASLIMGIIVAILNWFSINVIISIIAGMMVYVSVLAALKDKSLETVKLIIQRKNNLL